MKTGQTGPKHQQSQKTSGLVATSVKTWYPHLLRDHEAITNVVQTLFTFKEYRDDLDKADKYRLANRAAYQVSKESGWRKPTQTKKWFRPESHADCQTRRRNRAIYRSGSGQRTDQHLSTAIWLRDFGTAGTYHEVIAILESKGITGTHVEQYIQQMFRDRATAERKISATQMVSSPVIRNPRHQFIADNWNKPAKQIAAELGISIPAVHMAAKAMGLPPKSRFWHCRP